MSLSLLCSIFKKIPKQDRGSYLSFHFLSILLCSQPGQQSPHFASSFFFLIITRSGRLAKIRWSVCISKSQRSLCVSFSRTDVGLCVYHLFVWSNLNFLAQSPVLFLRLLVTFTYHHHPYYNYCFSHQLWQVVFHWSLSDSKSPQLPRTLLSILTNFDTAMD